MSSFPKMQKSLPIWLLWLIVASIGIIGISLADKSTENNINNKNSLDGIAATYLPAEFRNFTMNDIKKVLYAKCIKVNGKANFTLLQEIQDSATKMVGCLSAVANLTAIQEEMEKAKPLGDLDMVFDKYCQKAPIAEACLLEFNTKLQPCLSVAEKQQNSVFTRLIRNMLGYLCAKGGDQIALFIAEEGPECIEANKDPLSQCLNSSLTEFLPLSTLSAINLKDMPDLVLSPKHCIDLERFEACALHHLQQCVEITPANVVESVFKFVKNEVNCTGWMDAQTTPKPILKSAKSGTVQQISHLNKGLIPFLLFLVASHFDKTTNLKIFN